MKPGSSRIRVGGRFDSPDGEAALIVAVTAPAVDGRANDAVVKALADALGLRKAEVSIVRGHQGRTKLVEIPEECRDVWPALLER